jgi:hypothetical protein
MGIAMVGILVIPVRLTFSFRLLFDRFIELGLLGKALRELLDELYA